MNRDGHPSVGERGIPNAVVAFDVQTFVTTDASGQFDIRVSDDQPGTVWVRVPDGFVPGPVWSAWPNGGADVDLGLRRLPKPVVEPVTFVVAADTHLSAAQTYNGAADLATAAFEATALDPPPAFFTILGDITQGNKDPEFDMVDLALADLGVPWVPVPGNHDWYDGGVTWFRRYGPDNYSFDIANVHFVVWNMALDDLSIRAYLGAELARVAKTMTIVALTHAPPSIGALRTLHELGVDYVLTGHAHSNRVVDHDGIIELNTEPLLMGGLDFTPAGYRVMTIAGGKLTSYHRTTVDAPFVSIVGPGRGQCAPRTGAELVVAAELDASATVVSARIDCATPIALRFVGGLDWRAELPVLAPGAHELAVTARSASGTHAETTQTIAVCEPAPSPPAAAPWPQLGGGPTHEGAVARAITPPLSPRWTTAVGGHVLSASPAIADGTVFVTVTDLGDGGSGGVVALDLATGAVKWRATTGVQVRGGVAVIGAIVVVPRIDGIVLGLDAATGAVMWRHELGAHVAPEAAATFASVAAIDREAVIGHQRAVASLYADSGTARWHRDPVPDGADSQSLSAVAIAGDIALGTFNRALGGVMAWDRATGAPLWQLEGDETIAINATPVISGGLVYIVNAADTASALELATGTIAWSAHLDEQGFEWGNATIGTPAIAHGILVVPTLYRDLVALDAKTGSELWRHTALPSPLRVTHYRGAHEAGYEASPVITGDIVWIADTSGELAALDLATGAPLWRTNVGAPILSGLATTGDWLVVASYDGTVRALAPGPELPRLPNQRCDAPPAPTPLGGCCDASGSPSVLVIVGVGALLLRRRRR